MAKPTRYRQFVEGEDKLADGMRFVLGGRKGKIDDQMITEDGLDTQYEVTWEDHMEEDAVYLRRYPGLEIEEPPLILPVQLKAEILEAFDKAKGDLDKFYEFIHNYPEKAK